MGSAYFAVVCLAVFLVIFWAVRNDQVPPEAQTGPFALRRGRADSAEDRDSAPTTERR